MCCAKAVQSRPCSLLLQRLASMAVQPQHGDHGCSRTIKNIERETMKIQRQSIKSRTRKRVEYPVVAIRIKVPTRAARRAGSPKTTSSTPTGRNRPQVGSYEARPNDQRKGPVEKSDTMRVNTNKIIIVHLHLPHLVLRRCRQADAWGPTQRHATQRNATQRTTTQHNTMRRNATQRNAQQEHTTQDTAQLN